MDIREVQQQRNIKWATRLEEVLSDFDALQLFQSWMGVDDDSSEHPLRLHFAIVAYREMLAREDPRAGQLAREIYNKFLRPKTGLCDFIEPPIRERVGQRLRQQNGKPPADLFSECQAPLDTFLRRQHAIFVASDEFLERFNAAMAAGEEPSVQYPSTSAAIPPKTPIRRAKRNEPQQPQQQPQPQPSLTAYALFRSQKDRGAVLPGGAASQRLFKPVSKFPYLGQAQPSKNDSAVSSAFSSEANRTGRAEGAHGEHSHPYHNPQGHSLRMLRDEQRRMNAAAPPLMAAFPRLEHGMGGMREPNEHPSSQLDHTTAEGRVQFAEQLQRKLKEIQRRHQQEESVNEQIEKLARQKGSKTTAREVIAEQGANDSMLLTMLEDSAAAGMDADEDLDIYCRRMMAANDSNSSAPNSAQQSPLMPHSRRTRRRSRRHGSCSPSAERGSPPPEWTLGAMATTALGQTSSGIARTGGAVMSQSYCSANPSSAASLFMMAGRGGPLAPCASGGVPPLGHYPLLESAERTFLPFLPAAPSFPGFLPQFAAPFASPSAAGQQQQPPAIPASMCHSVHLGAENIAAFPPNAIPRQLQPKFPFGIPPQTTKGPSGACCCDNDGDTSGIGSMTSATHSGTSAPGTAEQRERQRAAVFRKARELSGGGGERMAAGSSDMAAGGGIGGEAGNGPQPGQQFSGIPRQRRANGGGEKQQQPGPAAISHPSPRALLPVPQQQTTLAADQPKMTISYRDSSGDGVPVVAHVPQRPLTFREFRRYLSISSKDRRQFFFKVLCEDGSAPYQLLLVNDDYALVPMFGGRVTAECRAPLSDSD